MKTLPVKSLQPLLTETNSLARFMGRYYLNSFTEGTVHNDQKYWLLQLSDASGDLQVYCHSPELMQQELTSGQWVHVEAALCQPKGTAYFRCKNLFLDEPKERVGQDLSSLPRKVCPVDHALDALLFMVSHIENQALGDFVRDVLLQPDVGVNYLCCPASINYHHNYPGGLIEHSLEMAWNISVIPELSQTERDVAVVAALLHDIGKVWTLTPSLSRTQVGALVSHDHLTLEVCAIPMKRLNEVEPDLAHQLRHAWTCQSPKARYGFRPRTRVAKYLQKVDHYSAHTGHQNNFLPRFARSTQSLQANR